MPGTPARFPNGFTTAAKTNPLGNFVDADPMKWHTYFNDFDAYVAGDWTVTSVGAATQALANVDGGALLLTDTALDNDSTQIQKVGSSFLLATDKKFIFKARFKVSDATQSDFLIGLAVADTTLLGAIDGDGVTDGVFFSKDDGDALLDFQCQKDATTGQSRAAGIATVVTDTFMTVACAYDGKSELKYFVNDAHLGSIAVSSANLPDTILTISIALMNGEAVAKTMTIDYVFASQER